MWGVGFSLPKITKNGHLENKYVVWYIPKPDFDIQSSPSVKNWTDRPIVWVKITFLSNIGMFHHAKSPKSLVQLNI